MRVLNQNFDRHAPVAVNKDKVIIGALKRKVQDPVERSKLEAELEQWTQAQALIDAELDTISKVGVKVKGQALDTLLGQKRQFEEQRADCIKNIKKLRDALDWEPAPKDTESKYLTQVAAGVYGSWNTSDMLQTLDSSGVLVVEHPDHCEVWAP